MDVPTSLRDAGQQASRTQLRHGRPYNLTLLGWTVAGNRTHFEIIRKVALDNPDIRPLTCEVQAYKDGGWIEALPLPANLRGHLRSAVQAWPAYTAPRLDAAWTSCSIPALPLALRRRIMGKPPLTITMDSTPAQLASMATHYQQSEGGIRRRLRDTAAALLYRMADMLNPWSKWAAASLIHVYGVPPHKIEVIPPGVDLSLWHPYRRINHHNSPIQVLFVGGDFIRKGGDLLIDIFQHFFSDICELHIVTRHDIESRNGIYVHCDLKPNDAGLRALYASADLLVLPTRADCFSLATIEAMASGLPVIVSAVGGIPEIVIQGVTGFLVQPDDPISLRAAMERLVCDPSLRQRMGAAARERAERHFDGMRNAQRLLDLVCQASDRSRARTGEERGEY